MGEEGERGGRGGGGATERKFAICGKQSNAAQKKIPRTRRSAVRHQFLWLLWVIYLLRLASSDISAQQTVSICRWQLRCQQCLF